MAQEVITGVNKVGESFYRTKVTDNGDGTFSSTLFRTDAQGNNGVPIAGFGAVGDQTAREINTDNATLEEQRLLSDSNSQLNQVRREQVRSTESQFFGDGQSSGNPTALDQVGGGSGNQTDTDPNQPGAPGGSTPANPNETVTEGTPESTNFKYPENLSLGDQDVIQFTALEYVPSRFQNSAKSQERRDGDRNTKGTVTLPIQAQITDLNGVTWGDGDLDEVYRSLLDTSKNLITGKFDEKKFAESVTSKSKELIKDTDLGLAYIAEKVIGLNKNLQGRFGGVLNPNVELLFQSPQLRAFDFRFRMTPRTKKESEIVRGIIKFFKKNMAVKQGTELFLRAPNTFRIKYMGKNSENQEGVEEKQSISKIKECALISCGVNYTPQGTYMTFEDGGMVSYVMDLKFKELIPIYDKDYEEEDNHPIGY